MNWGTLGHSRDIEPLLVKLYDEHRMYQLATEKKPEARAELTHTVAGLLAGELKFSEKEIIADILINLMRQAEIDLKQALAERLATLENVPLRLVLHLAQAEIGIAESILRSSPVLNDLDLLYIIQAHDADYWRVIASRQKLNEPVIDALADTRDVPTACTLARNEAVALTEHAIEIMAELAESTVDVARPLLSRREVPKVLARKLYAVVGTELKKTIEIIAKTDTALKSNEAEVLASVKDILLEFSPAVRSEFMPTPAMMKAAAFFAQKGQLTADLMLKTLKRGQISSFIAQLATYAGIVPARIITILAAEEGTILAALCKAGKLSRDDYIGIYLMTQKTRDSEGRVNHAAFNKSVVYFDRLTRSDADQAIASYR